MFAQQKIINLLISLLSVVMLYYEVTFGKLRAILGSKPHIILIVADDMGWNDVSFHGANEIPTPNIDALAYNGVILNRHYVLPVCTPSRTSLMTGRYAIREGLQGVPINPGEPKGLRLNVTIMPEYMRQLGYETQLVGKWHLGYETKNHTPARRGFDSFFGYYNGYITYFNKTIDGDFKNGSFVRGYDLHRDRPNGLHIEFNNTEYFTDIITTEAEEIIRSNGNEKPLFLEIAHLAAHASDSLIETLEVRNATENDETFSYIKDSKSRKYAGMIKAMDDSVGRVIKALSDANMLENSIIIFISDNGAPTIGDYETPGSNYPLRGIKNTVFEGGIRGVACIFSPLIINRSRVSEELIHVTDWLPTIYSAAGGEMSDHDEIDGVDQWDSLVNGSASSRQNLLVNINELTGLDGAIVGRYKLIRGVDSFGDSYYGRSGNDASFPDYDIKNVLASAVGRAISQLPGFNSVSPSKARIIRGRAVVQCQLPSIHPNCSTQCLFDIVSDPCETQDLSNFKNEKLQALRSYIQEVRKVLVPQKTDIIDLCSLPRYFNNTWMPWRKDDFNSSTIIPESVCRVNATSS